MAKLAKKIKLNKLITADKQHMKETAGGRVKPLSVRRARAANHIDKKTDYIPKENLERIIGVARAHALWLHMDVLSTPLALPASSSLNTMTGCKGY